MFRHISLYSKAEFPLLARRDSLLCVATELRAGLGFDTRQGEGFISSPQRLYRLWGPSVLVSNRYRVLFLWR
jgi:hypothetical protein